jgi:hypothetical protein
LANFGFAFFDKILAGDNQSTRVFFKALEPWLHRLAEMLNKVSRIRWLTENQKTALMRALVLPQTQSLAGIS